MPITPTYPGVYIEEVSSGVRTITGVATSITAFIGRALRGPVDEAVMIHSFSDYERIFGGLWRESSLSYAVQHYFLNGGADALIIRVHNGATAATLALPAGGPFLSLDAESPGIWGRKLSATVDYNTADSLDPFPDVDLFNLTIEDAETGVKESFLNVSRDSTDFRFITKVLLEESTLVRVSGVIPAVRPELTPVGPPPVPVQANSGSGSDGIAITDVEATGSSSAKTGIYALDTADLFNLLCIPPYSDLDTPISPSGAGTLTAALAYCKTRRAMLIVDPPVGWNDKGVPQDTTNGVDGSSFGLARDANAVIYFPRIISPDPLQENRMVAFGPCGAVAGVMARTDAQRGVWKAPAGIEATLIGVSDLSVKLTDPENGELNPLGINCLRIFPGMGRIVWGARTLRGADRLADQWKYLPVRRVALFIEESLYRGTQWVVFEPNDEPLWAQIRLNLGAFMQGLFRQGAFQGKTPAEAYFVKCDKETTTQTDINLGIVNIVVGFAPLKPAEFVIIKIQQMAGQIAT